MDLYVKVRRAVMIDNKSEPAVARYSDIHRNIVRKMCQFAELPGYRRTPAPISSTLNTFVAIIDAILEARHTGPCETEPYGGAHPRTTVWQRYWAMCRSRR